MQIEKDHRGHEIGGVPKCLDLVKAQCLIHSNPGQGFLRLFLFLGQNAQFSHLFVYSNQLILVRLTLDPELMLETVVQGWNTP